MRILFVLFLILIVDLWNVSSICPEVIPIVRCVYKKYNYCWYYWSYMNNANKTLTIKIGVHNKFDEIPYDRGQPELFLPGLHHVANPTKIKCYEDITWSLQYTGVLQNASTTQNIPYCTGACCSTDPLNCTNLNESECDNIPSSVWGGLNTDCETYACLTPAPTTTPTTAPTSPLGACCSNDTLNTCTLTTSAACVGVWGGPGTNCSGGEYCGICCGCDAACVDGIINSDDCSESSIFKPNTTCSNETCMGFGACYLFPQHEPTSSPTTNTPTSQPTSSPTPFVIERSVDKRGEAFDCLQDVTLVECQSQANATVDPNYAGDCSTCFCI